MIKKVFVFCLVVLIMTQGASAGVKKIDLVALVTIGVTGYYGTSLLNQAYQGVSDWHGERDYLLYNDDLDPTEWRRRYDSRSQRKKSSDQKWIYGLGLITVCGLTTYVWIEHRFLKVIPVKSGVKVDLTFKF